MTYDEAIKHFGTQEALGRAADVDQPAVAAWKDRGRIPLLRQLLLERSTEGKLKADDHPSLRRKQTA
jgi:hypothetical protein